MLTTNNANVSRLPWFVAPLGPDSYGAQIKNADGNTVALMTNFSDAEYVVAMISKIKEMKAQEEAWQHRIDELETKNEDLKKELNKKQNNTNESIYTQR